MNRFLTPATWLVFGLFALSVLDSCSGLAGSDHVIRLLGGTAIPMSGSLDLSVSRLEQLAESPPDPGDLDSFLAYRTSATGVSIHFQELKGRQWRGIMETELDAPPGEFMLQVYPADSGPDPDTPELTLRLFADEALYRADFGSWCERRLGFKPWWITLGTLPLGLCLLGISYLENDKRFRQLEAQGIGTIFKLSRQGKTWEMAFSLGARHGIDTGDELLLLDRRFRQVGTVVAKQVEEDHGFALMELGDDVKPGYYVALPVTGKS